MLPADPTCQRIPCSNKRHTDPIDDYLTALRLLGDAAADVDAVIPGHGSAGDLFSYAHE